jgi:reactive intermediate/imine deaminase
MDESESLSQTKCECKYHVVFIPECRRKTLYGELRKHLGEVFRRLALQKESKIEEGHLMPDHVHMMISIPPKYGKVLPTDLPFSGAVRVGGMLHLSGQMGIVPGSIKLVEGGIREESRQAMENIKTSLEAHGYGMSDIVKCTVMLADISEWGSFNEVYKTYFNGHYPARSALGANGLALGARVEIECLAAK